MGALVAEALQFPVTAPVPRGYARRFDRHFPSTYAAHEVATGPYMLKNDRAGKVLGVGYVPFSFATLVRNPNWRRAGDFRPAYLNAIHIRIGGFDARNARAALAGTNVVTAEPPTASAVRLAAKDHPSQLAFSPGAGTTTSRSTTGRARSPTSTCARRSGRR